MISETQALKFKPNLSHKNLSPLTLFSILILNLDSLKVEREIEGRERGRELCWDSIPRQWRQGTEPLNYLWRQEQYFKNFLFGSRKKKNLLRNSNGSERTGFAAVAVKVKWSYFLLHYINKMYKLYFVLN